MTSACSRARTTQPSCPRSARCATPTKERWKGSQPGAVRAAGGDGRKGMYRAIADSPNIVDSDRRADIELVIHRIFNQHEHDLTIGRIIR